MGFYSEKAGIFFQFAVLSWFTRNTRLYAQVSIFVFLLFLNILTSFLRIKNENSGFIQLWSSDWRILRRSDKHCRLPPIWFAENQIFRLVHYFIQLNILPTIDFFSEWRPSAPAPVYKLCRRGAKNCQSWRDSRTLSGMDTESDRSFAFMGALFPVVECVNLHLE